MALNVIGPQFQFFDWSPVFGIVPTDNNCGVMGPKQCLLIANEDDLAFQIIIRFDTLAESYEFGSGNFVVQMISPTGTFLGNLTTDSLAYELHYGDDEGYVYVLQFRGPVDNVINNLEIGQCFYLKFILANNLDIVWLTRYSTQCFKRISETDDDACYTSRISFRNDENGFGFYYCFTDTVNYFENVVRVAMHLRRPQYAESQRVFARTDGSLKKVSSTIKKTYELITDRYPDRIHQSLKIALAHDRVTIVNDDISVSVVAEEDYSIQWSEFKNKLDAQASTRVTVTPFNAVNSSCGTCEPSICTITVDDVDSILDLDFDAILPSTEYEVNIAELINVTNCPGGVQYMEDEGWIIATDIIDSAAIDPDTGMLTFTTSAFTGFYEDVDMFILHIVCLSGECPAYISLVATSVVESECEAPAYVTIDLLTELGVEFSWPAVDPEVPCGQQIRVFEVGNPTPVWEENVLSGFNATSWTSADGFEAHVDYYIEVRSDCCSESFSPWVQSPVFNSDDDPETEFPTPVIARAYEDLDSLCAIHPLTFYIAPPDTTITTGAMVYFDVALTSPINIKYIVNPSTLAIYETNLAGTLILNTGLFC